MKQKNDKIYDLVFQAKVTKNVEYCHADDAIEEIEVATPVTFARYTGHPEGVIYGYLATSHDNLLPRMMNEEKEVMLEKSMS